MVTDWADVTIAIKYEVSCGLSLGIFTFDLGHSKIEEQDHTHFDCKYN